MKVMFHVLGKPPRKDGANSMWNKDDEVNRLISLRKSAIDAKSLSGLSNCIGPYVKLELTVYCPFHEIERIGDLDNFITGICDGLQAAHPKASLHSMFSLPEYEMIHPRNSLLLKDDSSVIEIVARKCIQSENGMHISYMVTLESLSECY